MLRFILFFLLIFFNFQAFSEDSALTLKQQLDRLQREVNDLSKLVYSNKEINTNSSNENIDISNITAFDMRIYDIEKEIKNLHLNIENLVFEIDNLKELIENINVDLSEVIINNNEILKTPKENIDLNEDQEKSENTLGTIKINSEDLSNNETLNQTEEKKINITPDEEFQQAFDLLRAQKFEQAQDKLEEFILNNENNDLSGSAHYWLGEIYLLKKNYREAALVFAEGYQKYPQSIKSPDILYKLSESLSKIDKKTEACNTLLKFKQDHSDHKLIDNINSKYKELKCE